MSQHDKEKSLIPFATAIIIPCVVLTLCAVLFINVNESKKRDNTTAQPLKESHAMVNEYSAPGDAMYLWQYDDEDLITEVVENSTGIDGSTFENISESNMVDYELSSLLQLGDEEITDIMSDIYNNILSPEEMSRQEAERATMNILNGKDVAARILVSGENCVGANIYIRGVYKASTYGVLTVKIKEEGFLAPQHKLLYDLEKGTCTDTNKSDRYNDLASVKTENGITVVTIMFPESQYLPDAQVSEVAIESSYSLFSDINGNRLEVFNVSAS